MQLNKDLGFKNILLQFSDRPAKRVGDDKIWDKAESALLKGLKYNDLIKSYSRKFYLLILNIKN